MSESAEQQQDAEDKTRHTSDPHRARVEWATLLVSAALLLAVVAVLTHAQLTAGDPAPHIEVRADVAAARRDGETYLLTVHVHNRGRAGARDVQLRVSPAPGGSDEAVDLTLDVLPPGASETAVVVLRSDPARTPVEARVVSYLSD